MKLFKKEYDMIIVGSGKYTYRLVEGWGKLPEGWKYTQVAGIIVDQNDKVYVFNRGEHPMIVFDRNGNFLHSWGEGIFQQGAHGICLGPDGNLYFANHQNHTVKKFTLDGKLLMNLGTEGVMGEEGKPFRSPTDVAVLQSGEIYVSDGYNNQRVHKFSPDGKLIMSWGEKGEGEGQFAVPHGIFIHKNIIYVADRENHRIQIFTPDGKFINQWKSDFNMPCTLFIDSDDVVYVPELRHRMSILNLKGELLARWGGQESHEPGKFVAPHTACTDSHGDLYIGEVLEGQKLQKFERIT